MSEPPAPRDLDPTECLADPAHEAYGLRLFTIGEDFDVMIDGHHDDRHVLAAMLHWNRVGRGMDVEDFIGPRHIVRTRARFTNHSEACEWVSIRSSFNGNKDCIKGYEDCDCATRTDSGVEADCEAPILLDEYCGCDEYAWWVETGSKFPHPVTWVS